jgi:hypothetical protein
MRWAAWLTVEALLVLLAFLALLAIVLVVSAVRRGGRREDPLEDDAGAVSRFTLPVSIIVPVDRYAGALSNTIASLLSLNFPELEVIVVADQVGGDAVFSLEWEWQIAPKEYFYRRTVQTSSVRRIFESKRDRRLIVVETEGANRADALNCGLSLSRFPYVACVLPRVVLDSNAMLRLMSPALRDPMNVVAATSHIERREPRRRVQDPESRPTVWQTLEADWQWIRSVRSWLASRVTVRRFRCGLSPEDTVSLWRRDALIESGGFSSGASDPVLDALVRIQGGGGERSGGEVVRTGEIVGRADPVGLRAAGILASHRQRAVMQAVAALRHVSPGRRVTTLCFLLAELLSPIVQTCVILAVVAGVTAGRLTWMNLVLLMVMLSFGHGAITAAALLVRGAVAGGPGSRELLRLLLVAPAEFLIYRPLLAVARLRDLVPVGR